MISSTCIMISPTVLKFQRMVSPTVLTTPHGTHDIPPRASWYPPQYWTPPTVLKITPHGTHDILPRYWTPPTVLKISPTVLMTSPTLLNTPHGTEHPHGTAHTLYRVEIWEYQWELRNNSHAPNFSKFSPSHTVRHKWWRSAGSMTGWIRNFTAGRDPGLRYSFSLA